MSWTPPKHSTGFTCVAILSVVALSIVAYLPATNNSFISDDFTMLPFVRLLEAHPGQILEMPSEIFRAVSYVYFWICLKAFGLVPEAFYWVGIALHALVSLLVGRLVLDLTRKPIAAWVAALFFAAYERHHEAVMWISGVNDALLTLFSVSFLVLWHRSLTFPERSWIYRTSLAVLVVALFSKEASVALVPLAVILGFVRKQTWRDSLFRSVPLAVLLLGYVALWLSQASRNFFVADGYYAVTFAAVPVFVRSFFRVLSPAFLFAVPLIVLAYRRSGGIEWRRVPERRVVLFFLALIALTIVPYSFLTYLDHIPSRNTYLPSVGVAALAGILFAELYGAVSRPRLRLMSVALLSVVLVGNVSYLWLKKDAQFESRAAPTRQLISNLNGPAFHSVTGSPIFVCGFPLHVSIGRTAVEGFTRFQSGGVAFLSKCEEALAENALDWNASAETYSRRISSARK